MSRGREAKQSLSPAFAAGLAALGGATLETLDALAAGQRRLVPEGIESIRELLGIKKAL